MATVHLGRLASELGVGRLVAVKRLHAQVASDPDFRSMFLDEARLAARIRHPNVVSLVDLLASADELCMILEYVEGDTLSSLIRASAERRERIPDPIVAAIVTGALRGLHAAHEARAEDGSLLHLVHRDVSPQNVLVGVDGLARVADFGVAKAAVRAQTTRDGQIKGKLGYMPPEQLRGESTLDRRGDIFAAGVVLWESLVQGRLFHGESEAQVLMKILTGAVDPPSEVASGINRAWDPIVERALALSPEQRYPTALAMAAAIEEAFPVATPPVVGDWVRSVAATTLGTRAAWIAEIERQPDHQDRATIPETAAPANVPLGTHTSAGTVLKGTADRAPRTNRGPRIAIAGLAIALLGAIVLWRGQPRAETLGTRVSSTALTGLVGRLSAASPSEAPREPATAAPSAEPEPEPSASAAPQPPAAGRNPGWKRPPKQPTPAAAERCTLERYHDPVEGIDKFRRVCSPSR